MVDPLQVRIDKLRRYSESLKRRTSVYSDIAKIDDRGTANSLGSLQRASAPGKKLQKVGFIMMWIPEPTGITCAVGGPMIVAGRYLDKKYNSATIHDIGHETKNTFSSIHDFKSSVM